MSFFFSAMKVHFENVVELGTTLKILYESSMLVIFNFVFQLIECDRRIMFKT